MTSAPSQPRPSPSLYIRKILGVVAKTVFVIGLTALLVEGAYRYYLSSIVAEEVSSRFKPSGEPSFGAYGIAPWIGLAVAGLALIAVAVVRRRKPTGPSSVPSAAGDCADSIELTAGMIRTPG